MGLTSCKKGALERKPSSAVLVPTSPQDLQGLLDNNDIFGVGTFLNYLSCDEFFFSPTYFTASLQPSEQNAYTWEKEIFKNTEVPTDWATAYTQAFYCNVVLEGVNKLSGSVDEKRLQALQADAMFKRSIAFYHLIQLFAPAYDSANAANDLGIPLKLTTSNEEPVFRATMKQCYEKMQDDLEKAINFLPPRPDPAHRNRASRTAAWALLARIYLCKGDWQQAVVAAENSIQLYDTLIDFNNVDTTNRTPFPEYSKEVLYPCHMPDKNNNLFTGLTITGANVDTMLAHSYAPNDLRFKVFFRTRASGSVTLNGTLNGDLIPFMGISTSEVYLSLAEAYARLRQTTLALKYLNKLLEHRWKSGQFFERTASDSEEALALVLAERQRELPFRGLRWADIKRLNKQKMRITLQRIVDGKPILLDPDNPKYALPLPYEAIQDYGLTPNPR